MGTPRTKSSGVHETSPVQGDDVADGTLKWAGSRLGAPRIQVHILALAAHLYISVKTLKILIIIRLKRDFSKKIFGVCGALWDLAWGNSPGWGNGPGLLPIS